MSKNTSEYHRDRPIEAIVPLGSAALWLTLGAPAIAQIIPDRSLPTDSIVTPNGSTQTIDGGTTVGNNLFHSFEAFSVPEGSTAAFNNAANISNILSRVTGEQISAIDGRLQTNGSASLFLLNPNGIVFGPNSSIDIGGSFIASTADSIVFDNGFAFSSTPTADASALLTVNVPVGLQFGDDPGAIVNGSIASPNGNTNSVGGPVGLQGQPRTTIAFIGSDVELAGGNVTAPSGRVEIAGVGDRSFVSTAPDPRGWVFNYAGAPLSGNVTLSNAATIEVSEQMEILGSGSGEVGLRAGNVSMRESSTILSRTLGTVPGGTIALEAADTVELVGGLPADANMFRQVTSIDTVTVGDGQAGNVSIAARQVRVRNGALISTSSFALSMFAPDTAGSEMFPPDATGSGGDISIRATETIELSGNFTPPDGMTLTSSIFTDTFSQGNAGSISINTSELVVRDGSFVGVSTFAQGNGGRLDITATNSVEIAGTGLSNRLQGQVLQPSALQASSEGSGDAGTISVTTGDLTLSGGGEITVSSTATGNAGNINLQADRAELEAGSISATNLSGSGGDINLQIQDDLVLSDRSQISTQAGTASRGGGDGGNINSRSNTLAVVENSTIDANAFAGSGGNIDIVTDGLFVAPDSAITASSALGIDGTVEVSAPEVNTSDAFVELPTEFSDRADLVATGCGAASGSRFVDIGRGGLPTPPSEMLRGTTVWDDLRSIEDDDRADTADTSTAPDRPPLVEASRWQQNRDGSVELLTTVAIAPPQFQTEGCNPAQSPKVQ